MKRKVVTRLAHDYRWAAVQAHFYLEGDTKRYLGYRILYKAFSLALLRQLKEQARAALKKASKPK